MKENKEKSSIGILKILGIFFLAILLVILFVNMVIIVKSFIYPDKVPGFMGWKPFIILSGSMEPVIVRGDLALTKEVDPATLKKGDVIAFRQGDIVIAHRIDEMIEENGRTILKTKGDANEKVDELTVTLAQVEGIFVHRIAKLGDFAIMLQTQMGMIGAGILMLGIILVISNTGRKKEDEKVDEEIENLKKEIEELRKKEQGKHAEAKNKDK